jgi:hypothetical protein
MKLTRTLTKVIPTAYLVLGLPLARAMVLHIPAPRKQRVESEVQQCGDGHARLVNPLPAQERSTDELSAHAGPFQENTRALYRALCIIGGGKTGVGRSTEGRYGEGRTLDLGFPPSSSGGLTTCELPHAHRRWPTSSSGKLLERSGHMGSRDSGKKRPCFPERSSICSPRKRQETRTFNLVELSIWTCPDGTEACLVGVWEKGRGVGGTGVCIRAQQSRAARVGRARGRLEILLRAS